MPIQRGDVWKDNFGTIRPYMQSAIESGMSFNSFYNSLLGTGFTYNRLNMERDWRDVSGQWKYEYALGRADPGQPVNERYTDVRWRFQAEPYNAYVEYTWTNPAGEDITGMRVIASKNLLSPDEYVRQASDLYAPDGPYADSSARGFHLRGVTARE
jgi:hypothetical protein